jgi:succinate dehydrogenase / fumarate reductase cytochrome b subunit
MPTRPLSPHATIYRKFPIMALSIMHRITGVAQTVGLALLVYWLMALAAGPGTYDNARSLLGQAWVKLLLAGWMFAFLYHLCYGIRHLVWDTGRGFEKADSRRSGWITLLSALALFAFFAWRAFFVGAAP